VDHVSWWEAELPTGEEMERGIRNLKERSFYADFIVSHCAPSSVAAAAGYDGEDRLSRYLEEIRQRTGFRKWFFGHYHENRMVSGKYVMLYEQIVRIC
jgi:DNA repair exonuclease SbcCD nuclease subunit